MEAIERDLHVHSRRRLFDRMVAPFIFLGIFYAAMVALLTAAIGIRSKQES